MSGVLYQIAWYSIKLSEDMGLSGYNFVTCQSLIFSEELQ